MLDSIYHMILKYFEIVLMLLLGCCYFLLYILLYMNTVINIQHYIMLLDMYYTVLMILKIALSLPDATAYDKYIVLTP